MFDQSDQSDRSGQSTQSTHHESSRSIDLAFGLPLRVPFFELQQRPPLPRPDCPFCLTDLIDEDLPRPLVLMTLPITVLSPKEQSLGFLAGPLDESIAVMIGFYLDHNRLYKVYDEIEIPNGLYLCEECLSKQLDAIKNLLKKSKG
jgi:hypothetical protein